MKWTRIAPLALAVAALGCSTMVVDINYERGTDFTRYRTFSLDQVEAAGDTIAVDLFESAIANALEARGLSRVPKGGDLRVSAQFALEGPPAEPVGSYGPPRLDPDRGIVTVELVDAKANATVWSAKAHEEVPTKATRGERQQKAEEIAQKIFEKFPSQVRR